MSYKLTINLKEVLEKKGITQKELASLTSIRESTISDIARNTKTAVNFVHMAKILEVLEIKDIRELIELKED